MISTAGSRNIFAIVLTCLFFLIYPLLIHAESPVKKILLLNSYEQSYKWTAEITKATRDTFDAGGLLYDLEVENMDTKRVNDEVSQRLLLEAYTYKFNKFKYDIVLTSDDDALNFALRYRDDLFPNVPLVFSGTNFLHRRFETIQNQRLISGVNEDSDIEESVDIALKLHPNVENIYFIHDITTTGKIVGEVIQQLLPKYQSAYTVTVYDGSMSGEEIIDAIKQIPENSLIYVTIFNSSEKSGKYYSYSELLKEIRAVTNVPIYGTWDFNLGDGIVGGKLTSGYAQGAAMAGIALRVLNGESIQNIPVVLKSPNVYAFDYKELLSHGVRTSDLPPGSIVINKPVSLYTEHEGHIWLSVAAFVLLIMLVIALYARNRFNKLKLTQSMVEQGHLEKMVSERTSELESLNQSLQSEVERRKKVEEDFRLKNEQLETFNRIAVDRELAMIKLKEKIKSCR